MSSNENPFKPKDLKRRIIISASASFAFVLIASIAGVMQELNPYITILVSVGGGVAIAFSLWKSL